MCMCHCLLYFWLVTTEPGWLLLYLGHYSTAHRLAGEWYPGSVVQATAGPGHFSAVYTCNVGNVFPATEFKGNR